MVVDDDDVDVDVAVAVAAAAAVVFVYFSVDFVLSRFISVVCFCVCVGIA